VTTCATCLQVEEHWQRIAVPFIQGHPRRFGASPAALHGLYLWATAIVSAYSFTLGDDEYQV
jgi:hypothetical protein